MATDVESVHHVNLSNGALLRRAIEKGEGIQANTGALVVETGQRTGRSPKDRFIVKDDRTETSVDWGVVNQPVEAPVFERLWQKAEEYLNNKDETFTSHLQVGADASHGVPVTVVTEFAWHNLFAQHLFINPAEAERSQQPGWVIQSAPGLVTDPDEDGTSSDGTVMINFTARRVLICGMRYAGEMKKAMFTVLNYLMPEANILPMHCAANVSQSDVVTLFFGLSGTGKTTLSADESCMLIGDDEHGWTTDGVFNFEGGCYAKCINLSQEQEPEIWNAISQAGAVLENVVLQQNNQPDYDDDTLTQNTRAAYSRSFLSRCVAANGAKSPSVVLFLACDCYGVLPPIASLTREQAAYYFLSGYTALVGSTEVGSTAAIQPTFSTCFGAPFFPRSPHVYAKLLMDRVTETQAKVYLINTGWTGGAYGQGGHRFPISTTRKMVAAATSGAALQAPMTEFSGFGFMVPQQLPGIDDVILRPQDTWQDPVAFNQQANVLIEKFQQNFNRFDVSDDIANAGPKQFE